MSLKSCIARDIEHVFLNTNDFCDNLVLQVGTIRLPIIGSLQSNIVQNNSGNAQPLQKASDILYIKYPIEVTGHEISKLLSAGTRITVDDKPFTVTSISNEMGLATVLLATSTGR